MGRWDRHQTPAPIPESQNTRALKMCGQYFAVRSSAHRILSYDRTRQVFHCVPVGTDRRSTIPYVEFMSAIDAGIITLSRR